MHLRSTLAGVVLAVVLAGVVVLATPGRAFAHASLVATTPGDGARLDEAPSLVSLTFSERVSASLGAVRVYDHDGDRVDSGNVVSRDKTVTLALESGLGDDSYVVTYRVVSADGHPVRGAFTFLVGDGPAVTDAVVSQLFDEGSDRAWEIAGAVFRGLTYAGSALAAGGALFLALVHDGAEDRKRLRSLIAAGAGAGALGVIAQIPLSGALATGLGITAVKESAVLRQVLADGVGWSVLGVLAGLATVAMAARAPRRASQRVALVVGAIVTTSSFALTGHTTTTAPRALVEVSDAVHFTAAAAWAGGLVCLARVLRVRRAGGEHAGASGAIVGRFSATAGAMVLAVAATGTLLAWAEVRARRALTSTTYGWLLIGKIGVVAGVLVVAAYNRFRLVPALQRAEERGASAWSHLRRTVSLEAAGLVVVLGITAVLVNVNPARNAAGIGTVFSGTQALGDGSVNLVVDPNRAGHNSIHLYLLDPAGRPASLAQELRLELSLPANDIGPIERTPFVAGPGHFQLDGDDLSIAGTWQIVVVAQVSRFDEQTATFDVTVNP